MSTVDAIVRLTDAVLMGVATADEAGRELTPGDLASPLIEAHTGPWAQLIAEQVGAAALIAPDSTSAAKAAVVLVSTAFGNELLGAALLVHALAAQLAESDGVSVAQVLGPAVARLVERRGDE
jgi:hypothetical protein